jgi:putative transcriptional regulator
MEMSIEYKKLFHKLIDEGMTNSDLAEKAGITLNVITRLKRNEYVSLESIEKICGALNCNTDEILEFVDEPDEEK